MSYFRSLSSWVAAASVLFFLLGAVLLSLANLASPPVYAASPSGGSATTTTTDPSTTTTSLPLCVGSQFISAITTSASTYGVGQTILITLGIKNLGSACWSAPEESEGVSTGGTDILDDVCIDVTATNASGQLVWENNATPTSLIACAAIASIGTVPSGWSDSRSYPWAQDVCPTSGSQCTQSQVPLGTYTIARLASELDVWTGVEVTPAVVTISASAPTSTTTSTSPSSCPPPIGTLALPCINPPCTECTPVTVPSTKLAFTGTGATTEWMVLAGGILVMIGVGLLVLVDVPRRALMRIAQLSARRRASR